MKTRLKPHYLFVLIVLVLTYLPILSLVVFSFNRERTLIRWTGFSFKWYLNLINSPDIIEVVIVTVLIAIVSTLISTVIGTFAAISLTKTKKTLREIALQSNSIPIVNPEIVTAISFFLLFGALAMELGLITMLIAHIGFSVPYVVITVYPKVKSLDPNLADAAHDLGATPMQALFKVILPQIKVAIIAGAAIAFTMSFDDFIISYFALGSSGWQNISVYLYDLKRVDPTINALSTIIILFIGTKIVLDYIKSNKNYKEEDE
jgi:spermidine/putrescine transport system permease protein